MSFTLEDNINYDLFLLAEKFWLENKNKSILLIPNKSIRIFTDTDELFKEIKELGGYSEKHEYEYVYSVCNLMYDQKVIKFQLCDELGDYYVFGATQKIIDFFKSNLAVNVIY